MKKLSWLICCTVLAVCLLFILPTEARAAEITASGTCGENLTWTLDAEGTLTISGTGAMTDYILTNTTPWYSSRDSIKSTIIEDGVTSIGRLAFNDCSSMTSISIPDSVTSIGDEAFAGCESLTSVIIPDGVTSIGEWVFYNCDSMTSITIPDSVTSIGAQAFSYCSSLTSVTIGSGVTSIVDYAFEDCSSLTSIIIPDSVTSIGDEAFSGCESLTSITIPDGVTSIGDYAFMDCSSLTSVTIGSGVTSIGNFAFSGCYSLADVYITDPNVWCSISFGVWYANPLERAGKGHILDENGNEVTELVLDATVTAIPNYAFTDCTSLTSITIPDSVTSIGVHAFGGCSSLSGIWVDDNNPNYSSDGRGVLFNKDMTVLIKAPMLLTGNYEIPDSVTSIGDEAFSGCESLTSITIPDGVTSIGDYTFMDCSSLTSIIIPDSVTSIGVHAFGGCSSLTSVTIGSGVTSIGDEAFYWCFSLTSITIPDSVTSISYNAFSRCDNLTTVFYKGTSAKKVEISLGSSNSYLIDATWHYEVAETNFADQNCYYCAECNNYFLQDGSEALATIIFKNWDGTVISTKTYHWGDTVTAPTAPSRPTDHAFSYTFAGWDKEVAACTGNMTYTATYTPTYIDYTVTFADTDGTVISTQIYHWGDTVIAPADPSRATDCIGSYAFAGWGKEVVACAGNTIYTATYTITYIDYIVVFKNWNGDVLSERFYHWGDIVTAPTNPTKEPDDTSYYIFTAWDKEIVACAGDATYIATYNSVPLDSVFEYTIANGKTIINKYTGNGGAVTIPYTLGGYPVIGIGKSAFSNCIGLTSITIPGCVTSIGDYAFSNCNTLTSIIIYEGITSLPSSAFSGCNNVKILMLPKSITALSNPRTFFDIFTDAEFLLRVAPNSYIEELAIQYSIPYEYAFTGLGIAKEPVKKVYFEGEDLNLDGMVVLYGDETGQAREIIDFSVSGYDSDPGIKTITLSYQGYSDSFAIVVVDKNDFANGSGRVEDPFLISSIEDLLAIEEANKKYAYPFYYRLVNNITLPDNWTPICNANAPFLGTLDGNGFTITNLTTDSAAPSRTIGLFHTNNGMITNLTVADVDVNATYLAGSVNVGCIAVNNNGTISNCSAVGKINILMDDKSSYGSTSNACLGGIAAYNSGTITGCRNEVVIVAKSYPSTGGSSSVFKKIHATIYAGGVVGNSSGGTLIYNENYGDISVTTSMGISTTTDTVYELNAYAGGIAAYSYGSIQQSRNFGNVFSGLGNTALAQSRINVSVYAGGIVGDGMGCTNCYSTGKISSNGTYVTYRESVNGSWKYYTRGQYYFGGIVGNGSASACYSTGKTTGCTTNDDPNYIHTGSICGSGSASACYSGTDDSMKLQSTYVGFDFDTIWRMPTAGAYMYPTLQCFADTLDSIYVSTLPAKLTYRDSQETLDLTGGMLTLVYGDGRMQTIQITLDMVLGFDNKTIGKQSVYIQYLGRTTSFEVEVIAPTIVFVDYDGTIISSKIYRYGETVTPPSAPTRLADNTYTYTFAGWDKEVAICQGDAIYTATYDTEYIEYTVEFRNWNGTVISRTNYHYGDTILAPTNVGRPADKIYSYKFAGWDQDASVCQGNAVYTAVYEESLINYTVTFQNYDGSVISSKTYHYGDTVEIPIVTVTPSDKVYNYYFIGWDSNVTTCQGDMTYTAAYSTEYIEYTITFKNWDGSLISSKTYHYGETIEVPATPQKPADQMHTYVFVGWDADVTVCEEDATYTAVFKNQFTPGDIDGDEAVTQDDAVYLLLHTMFGEAFYPLNNAPADIDGSGSVDQEDAVYLLLHTMFGEMFYPLNTPALPVKAKE